MEVIGLSMDTLYVHCFLLGGVGVGRGAVSIHVNQLLLPCHVIGQKIASQNS